MPHQEKQSTGACVLTNLHLEFQSFLYWLGYPIPMFSCSHSEEYFVSLVKISPEATYAHCFLSLTNISEKSGLNKPNFFNISSCAKFSNPLIILVTLLWILAHFSILCLELGGSLKGPHIIK